MRRDVHYLFYEIKLANVNQEQQFNAHTVVGMRSLHQVRNVGLDKISLQIWNLSCFCKFCIDGGDGPCDHLDYVPVFSFIQLVPYRPEDVKNEIEEDNCLISNDKEMLATTLNVGKHFVVIATKDNIEGNDFWILICEEALVG